MKEEHPDRRLAMATARTSSPDVSACNNHEEHGSYQQSCVDSGVERCLNTLARAAAWRDTKMQQLLHTSPLRVLDRLKKKKRIASSRMVCNKPHSQSNGRKYRLCHEYKTDLYALCMPVFRVGSAFVADTGQMNLFACTTDKSVDEFVRTRARSV